MGAIGFIVAILREEGLTMGKLKFAELVISAVSSLLSIAKYVVKLVDYLGRIIRRTPVASSA
jgi:hypothetical protein